MTDAPRPAPFHKRHRRTISVGLSVVGLALLALAIYFSLGTARGLAQASDAISRLTWWHIAIALGVPLVNFFLTSLIFWLLTARGLRGITPVPRGITYGEMLALITSGTLLNQLPGKPGIVGRKPGDVARFCLDALSCGHLHASAHHDALTPPHR